MVWPPPDTSYIGLTGSLPGAHIRAELKGRRLHIRVRHPYYALHRVVRRESDGSLVIHNESFALKRGVARGTGIGTRVFARQVEGAQRLGITKITTKAYGDAQESRQFPDTLNGWYTWARLGYNAPVPGDVAQLLTYAPAGSPLHRLGQSRSLTLHQLFDTPGGADFWRAYGEGFRGEFDTRPNSPHRQRLDKVCYEKGIDPYAD